MIDREISPKLLSLARKFPIVSLTGPRQSGKSTLVKALFPQYSYVSLEDADYRAFASDDPRGFLSRFGAHTVIDEAQRAPEIFPYLQGFVDQTGEPGQFVISGSQNFLLMEAIDQSLAGRVAILNLLPFSAEELKRADRLPTRINEWLYTGGYPRIYDRDIDPADYYPNYVQTYLERDVRQATTVTKLAEFERLLGLCAVRNSEMLNLQSLSRDCGVAVNTIREWLSVLEASFLVSRLQPYSGNLGTRLTKTPKLYLRDTGLACSLAGIEDPADLDLSSLRGPMLETAVIEEVSKAYYSRGRRPKLYYYRDSAKREIDLLIERGVSLAWGIEVKASATYTPRFFKNLDVVGETLGLPAQRRVVVYTGSDTFETSHGIVCALADLRTLGI